MFKLGKDKSTSCYRFSYSVDIDTPMTFIQTNFFFICNLVT